jgi:hypothetical protein
MSGSVAVSEMMRVTLTNVRGCRFAMKSLARDSGLVRQPVRSMMLFTTLAYTSVGEPVTSSFI